MPRGHLTGKLRDHPERIRAVSSIDSIDPQLQGDLAVIPTGRRGVQIDTSGVFGSASDPGRRHPPRCRLEDSTGLRGSCPQRDGMVLRLLVSRHLSRRAKRAYHHLRFRPREGAYFRPLCIRMRAHIGEDEYEHCNAHRDLGGRRCRGLVRSATGARGARRALCGARGSSRGDAAQRLARSERPRR